MIFFMVYFCLIVYANGKQAGPDPWNYDNHQIRVDTSEHELPPDLRSPLKKEKPNDKEFGYGEWWFRRLLAILLKSGQVKKSEDGYIDTLIVMKFDEEKWKDMDECLKSEDILTNDEFRKVVGHVEEAIYKPTITDKIAVAWTDYFQFYLIEYKTYITYLLGLLSAVGLVMWLWNNMSHKLFVVIIIAFLYVYEVIISYKELEQKEYEKLLLVLNSCNWWFWKSDCAVPQPDPILFMKHMNPAKIAIRMFTSLISEPILCINSTIKVIVEDITDGLWFPLNKIMYGILIVFINISLIYLLVMFIFNFLFNIRTNLNFLGIIGVGVEYRQSTLLSNATHEQRPQINDGDRISGDRLDRFLSLCHTLAVNNVQNRPNNHVVLPRTDLPRIKRSSSTGRLPSLASYNDKKDSNSNLTHRNITGRGEGDH